MWVEVAEYVPGGEIRDFLKIAARIRAKLSHPLLLGKDAKDKFIWC